MSLRSLPVLALLVALVARPAAAQSGDDANPTTAQLTGDVTGVVSALHDNGLGLSKGCDYAKYVALANTAVTTLGSVKSLGDTYKRLKSGFGGGIPMTDYIGAAFSAAEANQTKKGAKGQFQNLLLNIEQACQSYIQSENVARQYEVLQAGKVNIGNAINYVLSGQTGLEHRRLPAKDSTALTQQWTNAFEAELPPGAGPQDSLWRTAAVAMRQAVSASNDMIASLDRIERELKDLEGELTLYATWEASTGARQGSGNTTPSMGQAAQSGKWTCPDGYPDPSRPDVVLKNGKRVCGPASPDRSTQILAHIEVLKTQIIAIQMNADARGLQVDAVRLAVTTTRDSKDAYVGLMSAGMF